MSRPPRNQTVVIAVTLQQRLAIRSLASDAGMSISEFMSSLICRKHWRDIDKRAIVIQTGAASNNESGNDR